MSEKSAEHNTERPTDLTYLGKKAEELIHLLAYHKTPTTKADLFAYIALALWLIDAVDWSSLEDLDGYESIGEDAFNKVRELEKVMLDNESCVRHI